MFLNAVFLCCQYSILFRYKVFAITWVANAINGDFSVEKAEKKTIMYSYLTFNYSFGVSIQAYFMNCLLYYLCGLAIITFIMAPRRFWTLEMKSKKTHRSTEQNNSSGTVEKNEIQWIECAKKWVEVGLFATLIRQIQQFCAFKQALKDVRQYKSKKKNGNVKFSKRKQEKKN